MRFQSFLSLITYLAIGIVSLTVWTKKSEARIGCSYREINNLEKMVSEETAKKYIEWVCEGKKPDMPANFGRRKSHDKSDLFFGGSGTDSFHLEYGPIGILSSDSGVLDVYYQYLLNNRIALGSGLYQLDGSPAFGDLFLLGGYHFEFEGIGEFLPQLRYGPNLGFQAVIPYSMQFGSYFAGAGFKINGLPPWKSNDFVIGIHGGYKF